MYYGANICHLTKSFYTYNFARCLATRTTSIARIRREFKESTLKEEDRPVTYSTSNAMEWHAAFTGQKDNRLWYEPPVVLLSIAALLIYFCILRKENDVDMELSTSLYDRIEGLEEHQLRMLLKHNGTEGSEAKDIINRLEEIEKSKKV